MLETIETTSTLTMVGTVVAALLGLALVYAAAQWWRWRGKRTAGSREAVAPSFEGREAKPRLVSSELPTRDRAADRSLDLSVPNPKILGKLRSGREGDRPSEDDLAQRHVGRRGLPGEPARPNALPENITQIPKPLDPGHTA